MKFEGGLPETPCGKGSTLKATALVRYFLPELLKNLGVRSLLDAPCGDGNWMATVDLDGVIYTGADIEPEYLEIARKLRPDRSFVRMDIVLDPLPCVDLLLCRDFLQHLPNLIANQFLRNFAESEIEWLLVTSHRNATNENIDHEGGFRPLNLCKPPFSLPEPRYAIEDGGRDLALWHRAVIDRC